MPEITFSFATDAGTRDMVVGALRNAVHPVTGDRPSSVNLEIGMHADDRVVMTFPEPRPDIPALIKVWHLNPTKDTKAKLWQAIRDRTIADPTMANMAVSGDGLAYIAERGGVLAIQ